MVLKEFIRVMSMPTSPNKILLHRTRSYCSRALQDLGTGDVQGALYVILWKPASRFVKPLFERCQIVSLSCLRLGDQCCFPQVVWRITRRTLSKAHTSAKARQSLLITIK